MLLISIYLELVRIRKGLQILIKYLESYNKSDDIDNAVEKFINS